MKNTIILFLFITSLGYSQEQYERWFSTVDLEFIVPNNVEYDYHYTAQPGLYIDEIENSKTAFGVSYSYNYSIFKKLSLGITTGYQVQGRPNISMFKLGPIIRFFFVNNDNVYLFLSPFTYNFSTNKERLKHGANTRIGIGFPVLKKENFNLNLNVFYEINDLSLEGTKPLYDNEVPQNIIFRSFGASIGAKF